MGEGLAMYRWVQGVGGCVSPLPQVVPDGCLVQALTLVQEAGDLLRCVLQKFILHQELDTLVGRG